MNQLSRKATHEERTLPLKIIQFGGGNFLRAFVDWMIQILNEEANFNSGVVIIKPTERGDYQTLKSQDGLYTVVLDGIINGELISEKRLIDCVQEVVNPYSEWDAYLALAESPDMRFIVSNTTEAGIKFNSQDNFGDNPPKEFPAKLTAWLYHRFRYFNGDASKGCVLLPCELIEDNGAALKKCTLQYADHWKLNDGFKNWIVASNHFCSTLVDRIVSGYPSDQVEGIQKELGYNDELLVTGEYYHSWVIQGNRVIQKELPFSKTGLNVEFVDDIGPYREMKVRILNGAHTTMVPVGYLAGIRLVEEAMEDPEVSHFVESLLLEEAAATLDFTEAVKTKFVSDVLDRFRNPLLKHQLISISLNSTSKFVTRLLPTLKDYLEKEGKLPKRIVFGLSALIQFYKGEFNGEKIDLKDDKNVLEFFASSYKKLDSNELTSLEFVELVLKNKMVWGEDLTQIENLAKSVSTHLLHIKKKGIRKALKVVL